MQGKPTLSEAKKQREMDASILEALLEPDAARPWAIAEIEREIGTPEVVDGLGRLARAGLVYRLDSFVWASRSAIAADALDEE